jgi:hypothetical protein
MLENQEGATPEPTIEELKAKVTFLESTVTITSLSRDSHMNKLASVKEHIQNSIDNDEWTDEELDEIFWEELAELLDLKLTKTVEIKISASWTATVKVPRSMDIDRIAEDITVDEPEVANFSSIEMDSVYEESFDVEEA